MVADIRICSHTSQSVAAKAVPLSCASGLQVAEATIHVPTAHPAHSGTSKMMAGMVQGQSRGGLGQGVG